MVGWDFVVEYALQTHDPKTLEKRVHLALEHFHENREWFRCSVKDARAAIAKEAIRGKDWWGKIHTMLPSTSAAPTEEETRLP